MLIVFLLINIYLDIIPEKSCKHERDHRYAQSPNCENKPHQNTAISQAGNKSLFYRRDQASGGYHTNRHQKNYEILLFKVFKKFLHSNIILFYLQNFLML
jgi:hypothetical protein